MSLDLGDDLDARLEKVIETALEADAEDFEQDDPEDGVLELEVCVWLIRLRACANCRLSSSANLAHLENSPAL